jgi:hypothetical protein
MCFVFEVRVMKFTTITSVRETFETSAWKAYMREPFTSRNAHKIPHVSYCLPSVYLRLPLLYICLYCYRIAYSKSIYNSDNEMHGLQVSRVCLMKFVETLIVIPLFYVTHTIECVSCYLNTAEGFYDVVLHKGARHTCVLIPANVMIF